VSRLHYNALKKALKGIKRNLTQLTTKQLTDIREKRKSVRASYVKENYSHSASASCLQPTDCSHHHYHHHCHIDGLWGPLRVRWPLATSYVHKIDGVLPASS